jgi:RecA-family ATPase
MIDIKAALTEENTKPDWLVEGIFHQGQMVCVAGAPGVGKSFFNLTLSFCIASNLLFLGKQTTPGKVLYFDEENSLPDIKEYLRLVWHGLEKPDIDRLVENVSLEHFALAARGSSRFQYMLQRAAEIQPSLIVIDTATSVCGIQDENDNAEASRVIAKLRSIKTAAGSNATMLVSKHERFSHEAGATRTIRGAKTWLGELDMILYHTNVPGHPLKSGLRITKLVPDKVRAFGLREELKVFPDRFDQGIRLSPINLTG